MKGSASSASSELVLVSLGHSNRSFSELLDLLRSEGVDQLVDVRRFPRSKRFPHFNGEVLAAALRESDIVYHHLPELGAFRKAPEEPAPFAALDAGWHGYAAYMQTPPFEQGLQRLLSWAAESSRLAIMCAERSHEHCHRQLLADALDVAGISVVHVRDEETRRAHRRHPAASVEAQGLVYPARQLGLFS